MNVELTGFQAVLAGFGLILCAGRISLRCFFIVFESSIWILKSLSLGGLISIYSGFLYPEVYSKLMIFSPSLWVEPNNNFPMFSYTIPYKTKVYIYGGDKEGSNMVQRIRVFEEKMKKWEEQKLFDFEFRTSINEEGTHNEFYWSQEFPKAVEWLFYDNIENPAEVSPTIQEYEAND